MSKRIFSKRMVIMLIILAVVFGLIFGFKAFMGKMMNDFFDNMPQPAAAVSTYEARQDNWASILEAVGTVNAVNGVNATAQVRFVHSPPNSEQGRVEKACCSHEGLVCCG